MTDPGVGIQSPSEPIVIFPMRKIFSPVSRWCTAAGRPAGSETKITLATGTGGDISGYGLNGCPPARRAVVDEGKTLGNGESHAGRTAATDDTYAIWRREAPALVILAVGGVRLRNRADVLGSQTAVAGGNTPGESARSGPGVFATSGQDAVGEDHGAYAARPAGIESPPAEVERTTAWHPSKI